MRTKGRCGRPVLDALVVAHPGEGDGGVEGNPPAGGKPVKQVVQLFPKQERLLVHQVSHLDNVTDQYKSIVCEACYKAK